MPWHDLIVAVVAVAVVAAVAVAVVAVVAVASNIVSFVARQPQDCTQDKQDSGRIVCFCCCAVVAVVAVAVAVAAVADGLSTSIFRYGCSVLHCRSCACQCYWLDCLLV